MYLLSQFPGNQQQQHKKVFHITCGSEFDIGIGHNRIPFISCPIPPHYLLSVCLPTHILLSVPWSCWGIQSGNQFNEPGRQSNWRKKFTLLLHTLFSSCDSTFITIRVLSLARVFFSSRPDIFFLLLYQIEDVQKCRLHFLCCYRYCRWFRCSHIYSQVSTLIAVTFHRGP